MNRGDPLYLTQNRDFDMVGAGLKISKKYYSIFAAAFLGGLGSKTGRICEGSRIPEIHLQPP